jgi:hypothetical protein
MEANGMEDGHVTAPYEVDRDEEVAWKVNTPTCGLGGGGTTGSPQFNIAVPRDSSKVKMKFSGERGMI